MIVCCDFAAMRLLQAIVVNYSRIEHLMAKSSAKQPALPENFESGVAELEALIAQMETGNLPLEASLANYQRGIELLRFCEGKLSAAEQQVRILESGELKPMTDAGA